MSYEKKYIKIIDLTTRYTVFIAVLIGFIILILSRFDKSFVHLQEFKHYYWYIATLFLFLVMFRFAIKILHCRKLSPILIILSSGVISFYLSPVLIKLISVILIVGSSILLLFSKEYLSVKKQAVKNGVDTDSLC